MLQHGDVNLSVHLLIDIGFGENDYTSEMRYRALDVLQFITDPTTLQQLTKREIITVRYESINVNSYFFRLYLLNVL